MKQEKTIYEFYVKEKFSADVGTGSVTVETDCIGYTWDGESLDLVSWQLWSSHTNDWVTQDLNWLVQTWPSKYKKLWELATAENFQRLEELKGRHNETGIMAWKERM